MLKRVYSLEGLNMKIIVVSGINLYIGGTLKVMQDCIASLASSFDDNYRIVALVHDETQYPKYDNVQYISYPKSRKSWLYRLYYEYIEFKKLSKQLKPYCWFSMHDTTPNVIAEKQIVYCHNPFPFFKAGLRGLWLQKGIYLFTIFSKYIYQINIKKNDHVIVQQEWIRNAFKQMFSIDNIVVSIPVHNSFGNINEEEKAKPKNDKTVFFYPATPMIHKNFELIRDAVSILEKEGVDKFEVVLTMDGTENKYAKYIHNKCKSLNGIRFSGYLTREDIARYYENSNCLLFPSKAETWGLPITEAKDYNKPIVISDLPYAKESVGKYDKVKFFDSDNAQQLADCMKNLMDGTLVYDKTEEVKHAEPVVWNWDELTRFLFKNDI